MPCKTAVHFALAVAGAIVFGCEVRAQVLYEGPTALPSEQGWTYFGLGSVTQVVTNGGVRLDTSTANSTQAGYSRISPARLNRTNGFSLRFTVEINAEAHANGNRAGFSIIVLADDARGIELGFWTNKIFAQSDVPLFARAEEVDRPTTTSVSYELVIGATNYFLRADGLPALSGPVRDYTAFTGPINPYRTPDFLFLGDDTTSAGGAFVLSSVVLITAPALVALGDGRITWTGVPNQEYTMLSSSNLTDWVVAGVVRSTTATFVFTNAAGLSPGFFRVRSR